MTMQTKRIEAELERIAAETGGLVG
ncbi:uncharacterized protein METZ01_LOCUS432956, partial [marine metagenome]